MRWWSLILLFYLMLSCASQKGARGIHCHSKPKKQKEYRVKRLKPYDRVGYSVSTSTTKSTKTSASNNQSIESLDSISLLTAQRQENKKEEVATLKKVIIERESVMLKNNVNPNIEVNPSLNQSNDSNALAPQEIEVEKETDAPSIIEINEIKTKETDDLITLPDEKPELLLSFRTEEINVSEGYSFNELIPFVINQDELLHPDEAFKKLEELTELLINNPQVSVTIIANTATEEPHPLINMVVMNKHLPWVGKKRQMPILSH